MTLACQARVFAMKDHPGRRKGEWPAFGTDQSHCASLFLCLFAIRAFEMEPEKMMPRL